MVRILLLPALCFYNVPLFAEASCGALRCFKYTPQTKTLQPEVAKHLRTHFAAGSVCACSPDVVFIIFRLYCSIDFDGNVC